MTDRELLEETLSRVKRLEDELKGDLVKITRLADELDVSVQTIRRRCEKHGIRRRTMHGDRWTPENQGEPQYVSRRAWRSKEGKHGNAVGA